MHPLYGTPNHARAYLALYRQARGLTLGQHIVYGTCRETWEQFREHFWEALDRRINIKGKLPMQGRRWEQDWYWAAHRDQKRLQQRVYTRRFETDVVRARFAHREHGDD